MRSICPRCGRPSDEGLCDRCLLESITPLTCPGKVEVTVCSVCGAQHTHGRWQHSEEPTVALAEETVRGSVGVHVDLEEPQMTMKLFPRGSTRYLAQVTVKGRFRDLETFGSCEVIVDIKRQACDRCSKMAGKYFEGTIQVRGQGRTPDKAELAKAEDMALETARTSYARGDRLAFIQDIKETRGGIDIVVGSSQLGRAIAGALVQRFGGRITESSTLVGRKDGRDVYRRTFLVRFPRLRRGDVAQLRGEALLVVGHDGRRPIIKSLVDGGRRMLSEETADEAEILANSREARKTVAVAVDDKAVEILDPDSYQTTFAPRPVNLEVDPGDEVEVIRVGEGFILLRKII